MKRFGERLRMYRKRSGKSQMTVSQETDIPQTTISDWENSKTEPMVSDLVALANVFGITVSALIGESRIEDGAGVDVD